VVGGEFQMSVNQITGLLDSGHVVEIFSKSIPAEEEVHPDVEKYRLMKKVHYFSAANSNKAKRRLKALAMIAAGFITAPIKTLKALSMLLDGEEGFSYKLLFFILPILRKEIDIIHCHFGLNGNLAIQLKQIDPNIKIVTTFHGHDVNSYPNTAGKDVYNQLFKYGDLFTANSNFTKSQAVELGCDETKIKILPVGLDMSRFTFKARQLKAGETVRILTVSRLVEKKGLEYAIRAIAKLTADYPNMVYSIAGDGPLNENLQSLVSSLNLQKNIEFLGALPQQEILKLYDRTHLFLLPSVTASDGDREGQALVLQEAQACGIPVVSTTHNGIPDGVLDGKSGFLVSEKDVDSLAEKLQYLIQNPRLWPQMGKAGREFVEKKYDIKILNEKLVQIYQELLQQ
jgi:colanic acid/amylovoran biosynthesis glycosyltransferase